ncbi:MAG: acyl--CoA ligase, partial [Planctomycetes bacterium]|nr:acyl--CoA ligase [Planctomycetota bacterium]
GAIVRRLRASGIRPGDRLALCAPQHFEGILLFWAAAHIGAPLAIHDVALPPAVVEERLRRTQPVMLFASEALAASLPGRTPCPTILLEPFGGAPPTRAGSAPTLMTWLQAEDYEGPRLESPRSLAGATGAVIFTSGTTGHARGVELSQSALAHSGRLMARQFDWTQDDVHICPADLHTLGGLRNPTISTVHAGASTVITTPDVRANTSLLAASLSRHRVTVMNATPALLRLLTHWSDRLPPGALASVRHVVVAGSAYTSGVRAAFERTFRVRTSNCYGLTETAGLCISETPAMTRPPEDRGSGDVGVSVDTVLRVVDAEGNDAPPGIQGELLVHSSNLFSAYLDDPGATAEAFRGPWFRTRDRARLMPDGSCVLAGRMRDAIKNAHSEFVTVQEVQEALDSIPELADSGVGSWSDTNGQEHLGAIVVARQPLEDEATTQVFLTELRRRLQGLLGPRRMPSRIVVRESVPRNSNGKVATGPGMERILNHG